MQRIIFRIIQMSIGSIFFATSIGKLLDNRGFAAVLETYRILPADGLLAIALTISLTELWIGWNILRNRRLPFCAFLSVLAYTGYLILAIVTNARGITLSNCGCFGVFLARPMSLWTIVEDGVLLTVALVFWQMSRKMELR